MVRKSLNILFINHNMRGYGTYWRCYFLARELSKMGMNVTLITQGKKFEISVYKNAGTFTEFVIPTGRRLLWATIGGMYNSIFTSLKIQDIDIVHIFAASTPPCALPFVVLYFLRKTKNIILDIDDLWTSPYGLSNIHNILIKKLFDLCEKVSYKNSIYITTVTEFLGKLIRSINKKAKILKVPNGVNVEEFYCYKFAKKTFEDYLTFIVFGNTLMSEHVIQILFFLKALEKIFNNSSKIAEVKIIGNITSKIKNLVKSTIHSDNIVIKLINYLPRSNLLRQLQEANIGFIPYSYKPLDLARWPIRIADYIICRVPIISPYVYSESIFALKMYNICSLIPFPFSHNQNIADLKKCLMNAILNSCIFDEYNFEKYANDYSWSKMAQKLLDLYNEIVKIK